MTYITEHKRKLADLKHHIDSEDHLLREANGGNSILFSYSPRDEGLYIQTAQELFTDTSEFIDISKLFVRYIDEEGWESFENFYNDFKSTPHLVFHSDDPEIDLFDMIINEIERINANNKIPILIRTGCLLGTGIENVNIMEHKSVMKMEHPLVIFYPSKIENDNVYFLNYKPASQYRCVVVK